MTTTKKAVLHVEPLESIASGNPLAGVELPQYPVITIGAASATLIVDYAGLDRMGGPRAPQEVSLALMA
ncbi:MAG: hypothetical protein FJ303_24790 [Planctomycetes bacterium]|nr:hypothetical protein [Planctomycetota bacterium]